MVLKTYNIPSGPPKFTKRTTEAESASSSESKREGRRGGAVSGIPVSSLWSLTLLATSVELSVYLNTVQFSILDETLLMSWGYASTDPANSLHSQRISAKRNIDVVVMSSLV